MTVRSGHTHDMFECISSGPKNISSSIPPKKWKPAAFPGQKWVPRFYEPTCSKYQRFHHLWLVFGTNFESEPPATNWTWRWKYRHVWLFGREGMNWYMIKLLNIVLILTIPYEIPATTKFHKVLSAWKEWKLKFLKLQVYEPKEASRILIQTPWFPKTNQRIHAGWILTVVTCYLQKMSFHFSPWYSAEQSLQFSNL